MIGGSSCASTWTPTRRLVYFRHGGVKRYVVRRLPTDATG